MTVNLGTEMHQRSPKASHLGSFDVSIVTGENSESELGGLSPGLGANKSSASNSCFKINKNGAQHDTNAMLLDFSKAKGEDEQLPKFRDVIRGMYTNVKPFFADRSRKIS